MLSATEFHYLVGFLYLHTRRADVTVQASAILGAKVYDGAAEERRDVDIVVATAAETALIGVEVKNEMRSLDVITVEQICLKLEDMPTLKERFLVSTSGFTGPARKKARAHGLGCLRLVCGRLPKIATVDMSQLTSFEVTRRYCLPDPKPNVHLEPDAADFDDIRNGAGDSTPVYFVDGKQGTGRDLSEILVRAAVEALPLPSREPPFTVEHPFTVEVRLEGAAKVELPSRTIAVTRAIVTGTARCELSRVPYEATCFLENEDGQPFAAAVIGIVDGALYGLMLNDSRQMGAFLLPETLRTIRPIRHEIH